MTLEEAFKLGWDYCADGSNEDPEDLARWYKDDLRMFCRKINKWWCPKCEQIVDNGLHVEYDEKLDKRFHCERYGGCGSELI